MAIFTGLLFIATGGLWIFTALLWISTRRAVIDGNEALALARKEFAANHRPKLRIRNLWTEKFGAVCTGVSPDGKNKYETGDVLKGMLEAVNIGNSRATITSSYARAFILAKSLPTRVPYIDEKPNDFIAVGPIDPGIRRHGKFADITGETAIYGPDIRLEVYVMGWIDYIDGNNAPRRTAFCRQYDFASRRFIAVDNPDYEYED